MKCDFLIGHNGLDSYVYDIIVLHINIVDYSLLIVTKIEGTERSRLDTLK